MITKITGKLVKLHDAEARVEVGPFEYEVYIPEFVRRQLQPLVGAPVNLRTLEYIEGNPQQGRMTPRLVGFLTEAELEFFELVCSVDGMGVKKTLRAMVRPVRDVAAAIEEQDVKQLSALPGIGPAVGERIVAKLRRKMAKFALLRPPELAPEQATEQRVLNDAYEALIGLGHNPSEARAKLDAAAAGDKSFTSVEDLLTAVYQNERG